MSSAANTEMKEEEIVFDDKQNTENTNFATMPPHKQPLKIKTKKKKKRQNTNLPPGYARLRKELQQLLLNPPQGISACPVSKDDLFQWIATITGPENTPYSGGKYYLSIRFGENYPFEPPKVTFKTKIYHCNIKSTNGEICLDVLKDNYSPALTVEKILLSLCLLLQNPNPEDPLVGEIAKELICDKDKHDKTAKEWTKRYAMNAESSGGVDASS